MPLIHSKSKKAFEHNLKEEIHAGKPMSQSLAIAYNMKRRKKMADGGDVKPKPSPTANPFDIVNTQTPESNEKSARNLATRKKYAQGGNVDHPSSQPPILFPDEDPSEETEYATQDEKLNQHVVAAMDSGEDDIVDRIMAQRSKDFSGEARLMSEGGKVANQDEILAGFSPNEFDDLHLRDDLESTYGEDDNSGDALGNAQEDHDREDIVARIMKQRKMKQHNPRPA